MWPADILFVYGLAGLCLYPLRNLRTPVLLAIVLAALAVPAVLRGAGDRPPARAGGRQHRRQTRASAAAARMGGRN